MKDWLVISSNYISADRFWKIKISKGDETRTVYFPCEIKVGEYISLKNG